MSFQIYFQTNKDGKFYNRGGTYRVLDAVGQKVAPTAMALITSQTGLYTATVDPTGWADGIYYIHMFPTGKQTNASRSQLETVYIIDEKVIGVATDSSVAAIFAKMPTNYVMGSSVQADMDGKFDAVTLKAVTHTGAIIPNVTLVDGVTTVSTLTGHTPQTGDSYPEVTNATYGLGKIKSQADKLDAVATVSPASAATGSMLDRLCNAGGGKTYDQSLASLEAIRARGDVAWITGGGAGGGGFFDILVIANAVTTSKKITIIPRDGGIVSPTTNLNLVIARRIPSGSPDNAQTLVAATPNSDNAYDLSLTFNPTVGEVYTVMGTIKFGTTDRSIAGAFSAQ